MAADAPGTHSNGHGHIHRVTLGTLLITMGIVFGDIGTSPLYAIKAIAGGGTHGGGTLNPALILGGVSAVFWTLTFQTTFKYIVLVLRADNNGEGGVFSLYTLVRRQRKWLFIPAMLGGGFLLSEGIITPPISVSSAIEGLRAEAAFNDPELNTVPIVLAILTALFAFQQFGTQSLGSVFGYVMALWFTMIGGYGLLAISGAPEVLKALNPYYAYQLLVEYPGGFWLLGAVFLCTTGAEALYSDLGHVGRRNIRMAWIYVKICLLLSYFGQSAYLLGKIGQPFSEEQSTFYAIVPVEWLTIPTIIVATLATIVASQALISGSYTLINEAIRLDFWPRLKVEYPTEIKGQLYLPAVNWLLYAGCVSIVLVFRESSKMEAAYGLAVTLTMMMTTTLLAFFLLKRVSRVLAYIVIPIIFVVEISFTVANATKFAEGAYISLIIGLLLAGIMWFWYMGRRIKNRYRDAIDVGEFLPKVRELQRDTDVPKFATHLVYLTFSDDAERMDRRILYSILNRQPKRADVYWMLNVQVVDEPYRMSYKVKPLDDEQSIFYIQFKLGFRIEPRINLFFRKVIESMVKNGEVDITSRYSSLGRFKIAGDFNFVILTSFLSYDNDLPPGEQIIMQMYFLLNRMAISDPASFGLDTSQLTVEKVPLIIAPAQDFKLVREYD